MTRVPAKWFLYQEEASVDFHQKLAGHVVLLRRQTREGKYFCQITGGRREHSQFSGRSILRRGDKGQMDGREEGVTLQHVSIGSVRSNSPLVHHNQSVRFSSEFAERVCCLMGWLEWPMQGKHSQIKPLWPLWRASPPANKAPPRDVVV